MCIFRISFYNKKKRNISPRTQRMRVYDIQYQYRTCILSRMNNFIFDCEHK